MFVDWLEPDLFRVADFRLLVWSALNLVYTFGHCPFSVLVLGQGRGRDSAGSYNSDILFNT